MSSISKVGDNFIATWFYRESKDDYSVYTNVAMSSYSAKFYELYLKATLFSLLRGYLTRMSD